MTTRVLLIADEGCASDGLPTPIAEAVDGADSVVVVAPIMGSRIETLTEDESLYDEADARAERLVSGLRDGGIDAEGQRSESGPLEAALGQLQHGGFDRVVLAMTADGHWREDDVAAQLRSSTDVTVTEVHVG